MGYTLVGADTSSPEGADPLAIIRVEVLDPLVVYDDFSDQLLIKHWLRLTLDRALTPYESLYVRGVGKMREGDESSVIHLRVEPQDTSEMVEGRVREMSTQAKRAHLNAVRAHKGLAERLSK